MHKTVEKKRKRRGLSASQLKLIGHVLLLLGIIGVTVIQNGLLRLESHTGESLLTLLDSGNAMGLATAALLLQAAGNCALPIFAFLLTEGYQVSSSRKNYLFRLIGLAVICELPYDLAMTGEWVDPSVQNPVFALVVGMVMLYLFDHYSGKSGAAVIGIIVLIAAILWMGLLRVERGVVLVLLIAVLWWFRRSENTAMLLGCAVSAFAFPAPLGFFAVHYYNGERGRYPRTAAYLCYPVMLLVIGLAGRYLL